MNRVCLVGRLTATPELKTTQNGTAVTSFDLAVDQFWNGEKTADFFTVVAWQKTAELAVQYLEKGRQAGVTGRLQTRKWQDKNGNPRSKVEIVADQLDFLGGRKDGEKPRQADPDLIPIEKYENDEELPF